MPVRYFCQKAALLSQAMPPPTFCPHLDRNCRKRARWILQRLVVEDMLAKLNNLGGHHTQSDLDNAVANYVTPIKTNYHGYDMGMPTKWTGHDSLAAVEYGRGDG